MVRFKMLVLCVLLSLPLVLGSFLSAQQKGGVIEKRYMIDEDGNKLVMRRIAGYPPEILPEPNKEIPVKSKTVNYLENTPGYTWCYGCTATATAMFAGYYDHFGADLCYTGPENGGVQPLTNTVWQTASQSDTDMCPVAASKSGVDGRVTAGHGDDYWTGYMDEDTDPYYGAWTEHDHTVGQPCTADFMGTNQWYNWGNSDGSTSIWSYNAPYGGRLIDMADDYSTTPPSRDGTHGMRLFFESLGYRVEINYNQNINGWVDPDDTAAGPVTGGYRYADFMAAIDAGRPVLLGLDGHSMLGYGYDNSTDSLIYVRDTWDTTTAPGAHTMTWGGTYSGMYHYSVSEIILGSEVYFSAPQNVFALNNNRVVTVTWDDPSLGTKNVEYQVFRDETQIGTATTESYVDNTASDGVHAYSVKAVYTDEDPDYVSFMSDEALVFVSVSVTEFHDDFESGDSQWLLYDGWGLDTQYKYAGTYSLSDSPGGNYADDLEDLTAGGSVGEIAPGLNFTTAADATCDFYLRYAIEESFDYLHFQSCKDGISWVTLKTWSSETLGLTWYQEVISLGLFAGESNVRFRFLLQTDQGYNTAGSNIDNFNITPSSVDSTPPFVYYTKEKDYYDNNPDGFEITTDITDFSGISYANVLYSVDGGNEITLNPTSVTDDEYYFVIPEQTPGAYVEFRFDCEDTSSGSNQSYTGPFFYQAGKHQVYDNGVVSYIVSLSSTPADTEDDYVEAVAVKFNSFHDDVVGVVVRGYTDQSQAANANMLIQIYADDDGIPTGTGLLPSPVAIANPATVSETQKWAYVDLSSYTQLQDLAGNYHVAISSDTNNSGYTITNYTEAQEDMVYQYRMTSWKYVPSGESVASWEFQPTLNQHTRIVTTNYGYTPGLIDPSPGAIAESVAPDGTSSRTLTVSNIGDYSLDYVASIDYTGTAGSANVHTNDFESALNWTSSGSRPWVRANLYDSGSLDGSYFAYTTSPTTGTSTANNYLTSGIMDLSSYESATVTFDQKKSTSSGACSLEASNDGTTWYSIYSNSAALGAWSNPNTQSVTVPATYLTSTVRFRFHAALARNNGYWAVDNISVDGALPYTWMTLDNGTTTSGTVAPAGSDPITVGFDATGLALGTYQAKINLDSDYSNEDVLVEMTVESTGNDPEVATNVTTSIVGGNLYIDWDDALYADTYDVYSSADPYGTYALLTNVAVSEYTYTGTETKMFFYIVSKNSNKESSRTITIKKTAKK